MFLNDTDYTLVIGSKALDVISQADEKVRSEAEKEAVEEMSSYLRPNFDVEAIFSAEGDDRNRQLVMYACDIALYHMAASLPARMGIEIRKERYERAIKWLEGVQAGKILPDLPHHVDEDDQSSGQIRYGSQTMVDNSY
jgi:phage gp36-like protein